MLISYIYLVVVIIIVVIVSFVLIAAFVITFPHSFLPFLGVILAYTAYIAASVIESVLVSWNAGAVRILLS